MTLNRRQFATGALSVGASLGATPLWGQTPITIRLSHDSNEKTARGQAIMRFKDRVETYTNKKVLIEVYSGSQLFNEKYEMDALKDGGVQLLLPSTQKLALTGIREFEAFDLPFLFNSHERFQETMQGEAGTYFADLMATKGLKCLGFWDNGFRVVSANRPVIWPTDMVGVKIQVQRSKTTERSFRVLKASPRFIEISETSQAIRRGLVTATENTILSLHANRLYEAQQYITLTNHAHSQNVMITNLKYWETLPSDIQRLLEKALAEAVVDNGSVLQQETNRAMEAMRQSGQTEIRRLTREEVARWQEALQPLDQWATQRVGKETVDLLRQQANL